MYPGWKSSLIFSLHLSFIHSQSSSTYWRRSGFSVSRGLDGNSLGVNSTSTQLNSNLTSRAANKWEITNLQGPVTFPTEVSNTTNSSTTDELGLRYGGLPGRSTPRPPTQQQTGQSGQQLKESMEGWLTSSNLTSNFLIAYADGKRKK